MFLIDVKYDGQTKATRLYFYNEKDHKIYTWLNTSGHKSYCLTNLSPIELDRIPKLKNHSGFDHYEVISKFDPLKDKEVKVTKIIAKDPLSIGGRRGGIRDVIPEANPNAKVWEANIHYGSCVTYDDGFQIGMPYFIKDNQIFQEINLEAEKAAKKLTDMFPSEKDIIERWARLLEYPAPHFRRVALDIEVMTSETVRVPDPQRAKYQIVSCCLLGSDGKRRMLLLLRKGIEIGNEVLPEGTVMEFFDDERKLIRAIFDAILDYPMTVTFNGDQFDLHYIRNRALRLGIPKEDIPIKKGYKTSSIKNRIHIDLYKLFFNRSLKTYTFQNKYKSISLDEIGVALLGKGKAIGKDVWLATVLPKWSYTELAVYNCQDGDITLGLTTYDNELVMKLIVVLMRISNMGIGDVIRASISRWILSFLRNEHRRRNYLIPNKDDIKAVKGEISTKAIIKGKKYKGAIVVKPPKSGTIFNVKVMDFASLYPSILKVYNIGYQSMNCKHPECQDNKIPETTHHVCRRHKAMEGEIIGALRDLRVSWYKKKRKGNPWYSVVEQSIKVILNASYGVFGNEDFPLYCPPVSESVTAVGRNSIEKTIAKAEKIGIDVLYGDTDSVFLRDPSDAQIKSLIEWSTRTMGLDLEVDKVYRYAIFSGRKKNYLGVMLDGTLDVKGLTGKKKHIPSIIRGYFDVTKKYISKAQTPDDIAAVKLGLKKVVKKCYFDLKRRQWGDLRELAFTMTLGSDPEAYEKTTPQHVKAARILQSKGYILKKGDAVSFIKTKTKEGVLPLKYAKDSDVDVEKYLEMLKSTFVQILDAFDLSFDEIIGVTSLTKFM